MDPGIHLTVNNSRSCKALHKSRKYHPRQWVDASDPGYKEMLPKLRNTTSGRDRVKTQIPPGFSRVVLEL
jgi:hypothetical protein